MERVGGGGGRFGGAPDTATAADRAFPGLCRATFRGGYTLSIMVADIAKGAVDHVTESTVTAREVWHNQPNDPVFSNINRMFWARRARRLPALAVDGRVGPVLVGEARWLDHEARCC